MSSAGTAASLFVSRGRLGSVHCRLVGKPARLEQVPLSPKSLSPFSHTNRTWRKDLFVQPGARGRAVVLHKALLTGQNLAGKGPGLARLCFGGGAGAVWAQRGHSCHLSRGTGVCHTLPSSTHRCHHPQRHQGWVARAVPVPSTARMQIHPFCSPLPLSCSIAFQ